MSDKLKHEVARLTKHLDSLGPIGAVGNANQRRQFVDPEIVAEARAELRRRALRSKFLNDSYFGEGCWAILLDLFVCEYDQIEVSVTSSCVASGLPTTSALRSIGLLIADGMIFKQANVKDKRSSTLSLSSEGFYSIASVIEAMKDTRICRSPTSYGTRD